MLPPLKTPDQDDFENLMKKIDRSSALEQILPDAISLAVYLFVRSSQLLHHKLCHRERHFAFA